MALPAFVVATALAALLGAQFRPDGWYVALAKPAWTPPGWLFAPVWTALYCAIAVAGWLVWRAEGFGRAVVIWIVALGLNAAWSWLFFGRHSIGGALVDIALLWTAIVGFIMAAWPQSRLAAGLFAPYLAWVSFAAALNFAIWRLNA